LFDIDLQVHRRHDYFDPHQLGLLETVKIKPTIPKDELLYAVINNFLLFNYYTKSWGGVSY